MDKIKSLCVYCGASNNTEQIYQDSAAELGKYLAENDIRLVYGGGQVGLMGILASTVMETGGKVTGFMPQHLHEFEGGNDRITELFIVDTMHERKRLMFEHSDGFVILPGGFGTLDELCEILTWKQIRLHNKGIAIYDVDNYWSPLFDTFVTHMIDKGFVRQEHREFYKIINNLDELLPYMQAHIDLGPHLVSKWS